MYLRKDYMTGVIAFNDYYGQFVTDYIRNVVEQRFGLERLKRAFTQDSYLNTIPLREWDALRLITQQVDTLKALKAAGDFWSYGVHVCIVKQAAKQLIAKSE